MSAPDERPAPRRLDPAKMTRLALIRLLYGQAVEQSREPRPLSVASILTFHDTTELFLILAAEHLQAGPVARDSGLLQYWTVLRPRRGFTGVELSGQHGIGRLISVRNDVKHLGALPGDENIADARSSVTGFLEDNTPRVFGVEFDSIDMADVVPQEQVRTRLKAAAAAEAGGDRTQGMAQLAVAFTELFEPRLAWGSPFEFGRTIRRNDFVGGDPMFRDWNQLGQAVAAIQRGVRVMALGIDVAAYDRFEQLTPNAHASGDTVRYVIGDGYAPTHEEYDDCVQFVVSVALRLAELEAQAAPPSWRSP